LFAGVQELNNFFQSELSEIFDWILETMTISWNNPQHLLVFTYCINMFFLYIKIYITNFSLGYWKMKENLIRNPEDLKHLKPSDEYTPLPTNTNGKMEEQITNHERTTNIQRNEFESFIPFIFASTSFIFAFLLIPHPSETAKWVHFAGATFFMTSFTVFRYIYAFVYFQGLQPWRTIFFACGTTCLCLTSIWSVVVAFV
jgi:uncharacterized MAPEG superfamily protein